MGAVARLTNAQARRLFLSRHGLGSETDWGSGNAGLQTLIDQLGFVQVDSVNTVERAHHMILSARRNSYRPSQLKTLAERDRTLFEHWTHDASLIPTRFYPHWRLRFARDRDRLLAQWKTWRRSGYEDQISAVRERISTEGPCRARDVGTNEAKSGGGWWDWHPSKTALEFLWRTGELAVCRREGFQKVYDLVERVIPAEHLDHVPEPDETIDWACNNALDRLGFATSGEIAAFWKTVSPAEVKAWCSVQTKDRLVPVDVENASGGARRVFTRPEFLDTDETLAPPPSLARVLSPFDPALRDRKRAEWLFGFHYRIEIFVPEHKRKYGYYVFPVLEGDTLIGRVDMRRDGAQDVLRVDAFWPEAGVGMGIGRQARLDRAFRRTARHAGCSDVAYAAGWLR